MSNEVIFSGVALLDIIGVFVASRVGRPWLYATIAMNLILVSTFGAKLVDVFGFTSNAGNAFYAAVFFATHLLVEQHGKKEGLSVIPFGLFILALFMGLSQLTVRFTTSADSSAIGAAMDTFFRASPRIAIASIVAFIVAQLTNVHFYSYIQAQTGSDLLWLRDNLSNVVGQFVDSVLFFSLAFFGTVSNEILLQSLLAGYLTKVFVGLLGTPFLYAGKRFMSPEGPPGV